MGTPKKKGQQLITRQNVLESIKDLGTSVTSQTGDLLKNTSNDFLQELFGLSKQNIKRSGEISPGQQIEMSNVMSGQEEENIKLKNQILMERKLSNEQSSITQRKTNELRVELQAISEEIKKVAVSTHNLAEAAQFSMLTVPANPGIYHLNLFTEILNFLQSFRKGIDETAVWLTSCNKRSEKKNYWSTYKKKGSSFLLSPDHYLQRSAG